MRIVAVSDTHRKWGFDIPDGDIFIYAGDISFFGNSDDIVYFDTVLEQLYKLPYKEDKILIIGGNHDKYLESYGKEFKERARGICNYLEDETIEINGIKFYGSPWTPYINRNFAFGLEIEKRKEKWDKIPLNIDVLITHSPPFQILDNTIKGHSIGCKELQNKVFEIKPILHLFGHSHASNGIKQIGNTLFCNVSYDKKYNNKCLVLDLDVETKEIGIIDIKE